MYQVRKRDGRLVAFDMEKVISGITKAGGTLVEAKLIGSTIENWLPSVAVDDIVDAEDIWTKIIGELKVISPIVANNFESYQKM